MAETESQQWSASWYLSRAKLRAIVNDTINNDDPHVADMARQEALWTLVHECQMVNYV